MEIGLMPMVKVMRNGKTNQMRKIMVLLTKKRIKTLTKKGK